MVCSDTGLEPTSITLSDCEGNILLASMTICITKLRQVLWVHVLFAEQSRRVVRGIFCYPCMALVAQPGIRLRSVPMLSALGVPSKLLLPLFSATEQISKSKIILEVLLGCGHYHGKMENFLSTTHVNTRKASRFA